MLEELLQTCNTVKATTYEEVKDFLETQYFDMAILDIMGGDGYKLLEISVKRKDSHNVNCPCVEPRKYCKTIQERSRFICTGGINYEYRNISGRCTGSKRKGKLLLVALARQTC